MKKSVLIIEDDQAYRVILTDALTGAGYEVVTAKSGPEALDLLVQRDADLIILDLLMPGMDGMTFYYKMKNTLKRQIPTIVLTNLTFAGTQTDIKAFMVKANTSIADVVKKVKNLIG